MSQAEVPGEISCQDGSSAVFFALMDPPGSTRVGILALLTQVLTTILITDLGVPCPGFWGHDVGPGTGRLPTTGSAGMWDAPLHSTPLHNIPIKVDQVE